MVNGRHAPDQEDSKLHFRKSNTEDEDDDGEDWKDEKSDDSETNLEEVDYEQVLRHIDNLLPVKELAGRPVDLEVLGQFGLVDKRKDRPLSGLAIFSDKFLKSQVALRAGTLLHKVHLAPAARYSEDIDLVVIGNRPKATSAAR